MFHLQHFLDIFYYLFIWTGYLFMPRGLSFGMGIFLFLSIISTSNYNLHDIIWLKASSMLNFYRALVSKNPILFIFAYYSPCYSELSKNYFSGPSGPSNLTYYQSASILCFMLHNFLAIYSTSPGSRKN